MTTTPWSPGHPLPVDYIRLGEPAETVADMERVGLLLWRRIHGNARTRRVWRGVGDTFWTGQLSGWIERDLRELRALHAVLVPLRAQVERDQDRVDEAAKA